MRATIDLAAENGISAVSTRRVARIAGVSEALMYNFFHSKEELLISCLYLVTDKIVEYLHRFTEINAVSMEEYKQEVRKQWNVFFTYLLKNASETLVFHEYVNSAGIMELLKTPKFENMDFTRLYRSLGVINSGFTYVDEDDIPYFWPYCIYISTLFAAKIIRGKLIDTEHAREEIWKLITKGLSGFSYPPLETPEQ